VSFQQINLYHDELRHKKINFSALMMLQISLAIIVALSLLSGFKYYQLQQRKLMLVEVQKLEARLNAEKIIIEAAKGKEDPLLTKQIAERTAELTNKQKVLNILSQDEFGNANGFVGLIGGMARQRLDGLWFTHLRFANGGTDVTLTGITSEAALLPKYLQRLSVEKAFAGMTFGHLAMDRNKDNIQWLDFSMQNTGLGK
jgi:Tfp pilus assembly protein PilN